MTRPFAGLVRAVLYWEDLPSGKLVIHPPAALCGSVCRHIGWPGPTLVLRGQVYIGRVGLQASQSSALPLLIMGPCVSTLDDLALRLSYVDGPAMVLHGQSYIVRVVVKDPSLVAFSLHPPSA